MKLLLKNLNKKYVISFFIFLTLLAIVILPEVSNGQVVKPQDIEKGVGGFFTNMWITILAMIKNAATIMFTISATVFDNLLLISLNTKLLDQDFIKFIWVTLRDLINSVLFLGAIYLALMYMLKNKGAEKGLIMLIVAVFSINFSLFASRLVIDAGNITAAVFFSPMSVKVEGDENGKSNYFNIAKYVYCGGDSQAEGDGGEGGCPEAENFSAVALAIGSYINPMNSLKNNEVLNNSFGSYINEISTIKNELKSGDQVPDDLLQNYTIIMLFASLIYILFAIEFFKSAFMFISRLIRLMIVMATSPIWFGTIFLPNYGWKNFQKKWLHPIFEASFCIAVYMFFVWLTVMVLSAPSLNFDIKDAYGESEHTRLITGWILTLSAKGVIAYILLKKARGYGHKFCEGDLFDGKSLFGILAKPAGVVLGSAFGAAKFAVNPFGATTGAIRRKVGTIGKNIAESEALGKRYASGKLGSFMSGRMIVAGKKLQNLKIAGKSDREAQNERLARLNEIEEGLSKKNREILMRNRYKRLSSDNAKNFIDPDKDSKYQEYQKRKNDAHLSELERRHARKEADAMVKGGVIAFSDEFLQYIGNQAKVRDISITEEQKNRSMAERDRLMKKPNLTDSEKEDLKRHKRIIKDYGEKEEAKRQIEAVEKGVDGITAIEKINEALRKKYEDSIQKSKDQKLSEDEREKARKEAEQMVTSGKIKVHEEAKVAEMGIDPDAVKGSAFWASVVPALGAQRNRALEYNEGRLKAAGKNEEIEKAKRKRKEIEERKVQADIQAESEREKISKDLMSGNFNVSNYNDFDDEMVDELRKISSNIKEQTEKQDKLKIKIEKEEQQVVNYSEEKERLQNAKNSIRNGEEVDQDFLNSILSEQQKSAQSSMRDKISKLEQEYQNEDQQNIVGREEIQRKIQEQKDFLKSSITQVLTSKESEVNKKISASRDNIEESKNRLKEEAESFYSTQKQADKILDKRVRKQKALNKAELEQKKAILNEAIKNSEQAKRNALTRAKEGDVATITAADAQIDTL
ncbi:hypothetical protein CSB11_01370 [Candidatus Campbellbacteria bacterium]|nr:MAG: hypothetical protein CSB11_01370 [Candidatus Campbellbacteria bacterium]